MDSEALRTFLAIRDCGGFSNAAERLNRTQPAISRRIALLEGEIGAPLFERTTGGAVLSQAGRTLAPHAERVLAALGDCRDALAALRSGEAGPLSVAIVGTLASAGLPPILKRFARQRPGLAFSLRTATSADVSALVRRGEANIGLRYQADSAPDLDCIRIGGERLHVVCAAGHRRAGKRVRALTELADEHWLAFPNARDLREPSSAGIFAHFLARGVAEIGWTPVDSLTAQKRLAEAGFGLALLPDSAIAEELAAGALAKIAVADLHIENPVCLVTRRGGYLSPAARDLIALLRSTKFAAAPARPKRRKRG